MHITADAALLLCFDYLSMLLWSNKIQSNLWKEVFMFVYGSRGRLPHNGGGGLAAGYSWEPNDHSLNCKNKAEIANWKKGKGMNS